MERWTELWQVESQLTVLLGGFLAEFVPYGTPPDFGDEEPKRQSFLEFATQILQERATVLTFNYDTLLEQAIEAASGQHPTPESLQGDELLKIMQTPEETQRIVPEDLLSYSQANWNPLRAYGIEFDEVQIWSNPTLAPVPGERFYAAPGNTPYGFLFLKLHGSLNWYTYTGTSMLPNRTDVDPTKKDKTLHLANPWGWMGAGSHSSFQLQYGGLLLLPQIITPVLNKDLSEEPYRTLWQLGKEQLRECRRLVIGGYSFPPTDEATRKMFDVFAERTLDELVVINPRKEPVKVAKELCHFPRSVIRRNNLEEYLDA